MNFKLSQSASFVSDEVKTELEKLGFEFERTEDIIRVPDDEQWYDITLCKNLTIEINSLKELMDFVNKFGEIVLSKDEIEIYNDYRE